jgi:hypothetical protein
MNKLLTWSSKRTKPRYLQRIKSINYYCSCAKNFTLNG